MLTLGELVERSCQAWELGSQAGQQQPVPVS